MARWLQQTVQGMLNPKLKDLSIPVIDGDFSTSGDPRYFWTEYVSAADAEIALTWHDIGDPLLIHTEPNQEPNPRPYGVCTVLVPALSGRLTLNGQQARGKPWPREREGRPFSTSALAFWGELDRTPLEVRPSWRGGDPHVAKPLLLDWAPPTETKQRPRDTANAGPVNGLNRLIAVNRFGIGLKD